MKKRLKKKMKKKAISSLDRALLDMQAMRNGEKEKRAWKKTKGSLTGLVLYGEDGETLSEYISRKRYEEME
jgi:hypothetical protein